MKIYVRQAAQRAIRNFLLAELAGVLLVFFLLPNHSAPIGDQVFLSLLVGLPIGFVAWVLAGLMRFAFRAF